MVTTTQELEKTVLPEDPRFQAYKESYLLPIAEIFPNATAEQQQKATELAEQWAIDKIKTEDSGETDHLTGVLNKKGFYKQFDQRLQEYRRNLKTEGPKTMSLVYLDLDNFKTVNEKYRHLTGDQVLSSFGQFITDSIRPADLAGRDGGEEFVILLEDAPGEGAVKTAERIRNGTADLFATLFPELDWPKTVSCGVFQLPVMTAEQLESEDSRKNLIKQFIHNADTAHADGAKHAGKNRIGVMFPDGKVQTAVINSENIITYENPTSAHMQPS